MIFCFLGNSILHCRHCFAFGSSSKKQRIRHLLLWCISVNGRPFADWVVSCVDLVRIGLQGFLCLPPFSPWASFAGTTRALLRRSLANTWSAQKIYMFLQYTCLFSNADTVLAYIIELITRASTSYMITVHGALVDPFLAILSPH